MPRGPSTPTSIARPWAAPPQLSCDPGPEFQNPAPHRLIGNLQAALGEEILNVAVAQCEPEIKPDRVLDDGRREGMWGVGGEPLHAGSLPPPGRPLEPRFCDNAHPLPLPLHRANLRRCRLSGATRRA